jgi:hypothetical protein
MTNVVSHEFMREVSDTAVIPAKAGIHVLGREVAWPLLRRAPDPENSEA